MSWIGSSILVSTAGSLRARRSSAPWALAVLAAAVSGVGAQNPPGDASGDGSVTIRDTALLNGHFLGSSPLAGGALSRADANRDGAVDMADLVRIHADPAPPEKFFTLPGGVPLTMIKMPRGSFTMGSPSSEVDERWAGTDELPARTVTIAHDYYLGKCEITQRQWAAVMGNNPSYYSAEDPHDFADVGLDNPVENVSWNDIVNDFLPALNALGGAGTFRLPSEAEWEFAARGGTQTRFSFGESLCGPSVCSECELNDHAWWCGTDNAYIVHHPAGGKAPGEFGLYDMAGNVSEWVRDWWRPNYSGAPADGSAAEDPPGEYRVMRGGSWFSIPEVCRPSARQKYTPGFRYDDTGFRAAWTP